MSSTGGDDGVGSSFAPPSEDAYSLFVIGASGDLAKKKTFPSLYDLFCEGLLPRHAAIVGYARSKLSDDALRDSLRGGLKRGTDAQRDAFLGMCIYRHGQYDDAAAFHKVRRACACGATAPGMMLVCLTAARARAAAFDGCDAASDARAHGAAPPTTANVARCEPAHVTADGCAMCTCGRARPRRRDRVACA
jgi:hypothetical protein